MSHKVDFDAMPWTDGVPGARFKNWIGDGRRIRMLELREEFVEPMWCVRDHVVYVLAGELEIDFEGKLERFGAGDVIAINAGDRHKARAATETVRMLLVEEDFSFVEPA